MRQGHREFRSWRRHGRHPSGNPPKVHLRASLDRPPAGGEGDGGMSEREKWAGSCVSLWALRLAPSRGSAPPGGWAHGRGVPLVPIIYVHYSCVTLRCRKSQNSPPLRHTRTSYLGTARSGPDRLVLRSSSAALDHNTSPRPIGRRSTCCKWRVGVKVEAASEVKTASEVER